MDMPYRSFPGRTGPACQLSGPGRTFSLSVTGVVMAGRSGHAVPLGSRGANGRAGSGASCDAGREEDGVARPVAHYCFGHSFHARW